MKKLLIIHNLKIKIAKAVIKQTNNIILLWFKFSSIKKYLYDDLS